jgi:tetratricopeptide (TPR) repeat protein
MRQPTAEDSRSQPGPDPAPALPSRRDRAPLVLAILSLSVFLLLLLPLVGRPLATDDLWFHLKMGEVYASETLWPEADPMLYTAGDRRPVQHEWLFGVAVFGLERAIGLQGLRAVHLIAFLGIVLLAFASFRQESGAALPAVLAVCIFLALSWRRLYQLRPDLVSIAAAIAIHRLLLASEEGPSRRQVALATALFWIWANAHSLFAIGLALAAAGWLGVWVTRSQWARLPLAERAAPAPDPGRLGAAIGLGFLVALVNPRGIAQHLTFFSSARGSAIWMVKDEWTPFDPFSIPGEKAAGIDPLAWATMDALLLLFLFAAVAGGLAFLRRPAASRLRSVDPVLGALALASAIAILVSVRFLWMSFFILLFLLRAQRSGLAPHPAAARRARWAAVVAVLLLTVGFARMDTWEGIVSEIRREPRGYLATPYLAHRYCASGIRLLEEAGLQGHLFNPYHLGGYAGYRLAPRIRTFIDGRTEHYPEQVMRDYLEIVRAASQSDRRDAFRLLDEREVDIFLGVGLPEGYYSNLDTVELVAGNPDWILVYRSVDHAIYLRRNLRNAENLWRVSEHYRERGIPFDSRKGLSPRQVILEAPAWALAEGMISPGFAELAAQRESDDPEKRYRALDAIGNTYSLLGDHGAQIEADTAALALRPDAREPRRRLASAYLRERRFRDAERLARELYESDPSDERARTLYEFLLARRYSR